MHCGEYDKRDESGNGKSVSPGHSPELTDAKSVDHNKWSCPIQVLIEIHAMNCLYIFT